MSTGAPHVRGHRLTGARDTGLDVAAGPAFLSDPTRHCEPGKLAAIGADPDVFFSPFKADKNEAKAICHGCPVAGACLTFALENGERFGIWSAVDMESERRFVPKPAPAPVPQRLTKEQSKARLERRVRELWELGLPDATIALNLGLHTGGVGRIRKRLGLATLYGSGGRRIDRTAVHA